MDEPNAERDWLEGVLKSPSVCGGSILDQKEWVVGLLRALASKVDCLRGTLREISREVGSWPEVRAKELTLVQARLLQVCRVCKRSLYDHRQIILNFGDAFVCASCVEPTFLGEGI